MLSNYRIFETNEFLKNLEKLTLHDALFIKKKLQSYVYPQIKKEPCFGKNIKKLRDGGYLTTGTDKLHSPTIQLAYKFLES